MEGLAASGGAPSVHGHHDESERCERFGVQARAAGVEGRGDAVDLRAGVEGVDDRVALGGVESARPVQHVVDVALAVGGLDAEPLRCGPAGVGELADVGALQLDEDPAGPVADAGHRRGVDGGRGVDEVVLAGERGDGVVLGVRRDPREVRAVQGGAAHRAPVRVLVDQSGGGEAHRPLGLVDAQDLADRPRPGGDLPEQGSGVQVVAVQVAPAVALRVPEHLVGQYPHDRRLVRPLVGLHAGGPGLAEHRGDFAGVRVQPVYGRPILPSRLALAVQSGPVPYARSGSPSVVGAQVRPSDSERAHRSWPCRNTANFPSGEGTSSGLPGGGTGPAHRCSRPGRSASARRRRRTPRRRPPVPSPRTAEPRGRSPGRRGRPGRRRAGCGRRPARGCLPPGRP